MLDISQQTPQRPLNHRDVAALSGLTAQLQSQAGRAAETEYERFIDVKHRVLGSGGGGSSLANLVRGKRVLVTGGTGCIGSLLIRQLVQAEPESLTSASRMIRDCSQVSHVDYAQCDVGDRPAVQRLFARSQPEVIFHLAAERDPGRSELQPSATIRTNVFGTQNIADASANYGIQSLTCASTGKAVRYLSSDVYASTKKLTEWLLMRFAQENPAIQVSGCRFTHVVDNSLFHDKLLATASNPNDVITLHGAESAFYVQSALESVELVLGAAGASPRPGLASFYAIRDLGYPIDLLLMTLGALKAHRSTKPIHFVGHPAGYEMAAFAALYDPQTSGERSPLANAIEARDCTPSPLVPFLDEFTLRRDIGPPLLLMEQLMVAAYVGAEDMAKRSLRELSRHQMHSTLRSTTVEVRERLKKLVRAHVFGESTMLDAQATAVLGADGSGERVDTDLAFARC